MRKGWMADAQTFFHVLSELNSFIARAMPSVFPSRVMIT